MCFECGNSGGYHDYICSAWRRGPKRKRRLGEKVGDFIEEFIDTVGDFIEDLLKG